MERRSASASTCVSAPHSHDLLFSPVESNLWPMQAVPVLQFGPVVGFPLTQYPVVNAGLRLPA